jgi:hypothetical protein
VKEQRYCSRPECQKERKRRWHKRKMAEDPDYQQNRRDSHRRWSDAHPEYWQRYRKTHPTYVEKNRELQRERNRRRTGRSRSIAKIDASWGESHIIPGKYQLVPLGPGTVAKTDAINVELRVVPRC